MPVTNARVWNRGIAVEIAVMHIEWDSKGKLCVSCTDHTSTSSEEAGKYRYNKRFDGRCRYK